MRPLRDDLTVDVEAYLETGRPVVPISPTTRARAEARARASLASPVSEVVVRPRIAPYLNRWAAAAAIVFVAGIATAAAAYEYRMHVEPVGPASAPATASRRLVRPPEVIAVPDETASVSVPPSAPLPTSPAMLARGELRLLQRARAAMIRRDFPAALAVLAEHEQRFRDGRLAEEREALRVKALVGLGRTKDARRAFAAFESRFPRSPLLPALGHMTDSAL